MVKTYQLSSYYQYGTSLKIAPVTTEAETNANTCLQVNGTDEYRIVPQPILPDLNGFEYKGNEMVNGQDTQKWQLIQIVGRKTNRYTVWLTTKADTKHKGEINPIPVRYEMKGFNSLLGSHYDHYYLEYDNYDTSDIAPETFQIEAGMTCSAFPGPGAGHVYTFNPMREFVHPISDSHLSFEFHKFTRKHGRVYSDTKEALYRKEIFRQNIRFIHSVNRRFKGYTLGVNHLADKTEMELKAIRGKRYSGVYNGGQSFPYKHIDKIQLPAQFDWRIYGAVTPVKDQSVCGSCWSFGTIGAIEGAYFVKTGELLRLSQQALIDCSWGYGNNGCDGGEDFRAYQWMMKHGGIPTEEEYGPYLGQDGYCHVSNVSLTAKITGYINVTTNNEDALRLAIFKHGPISVAIDASHKTFSFYSNGVYYDEECGNTEKDLDHAVLAVGYGTLNGQDYWLIKNSWSNYWGNDGYVLMSSKNNNCGVMTTPTYVTM
ncbi:cysteine protease family c1-related [Holotrichia oblita]|uniref:Cysteine protease family c1-related n=1 Tax=Holotrichia oblita TaxID=644536 RepID=A0ACB9TK50_HOLOL|nr:cysteine protease family c1-related [Holotrichia oblita]